MKLKRYLCILVCIVGLFTNLKAQQIYYYSNSTTGVPASVAANATGLPLARVNGASTTSSTPCGSGFTSSYFAGTGNVYSPTLTAVSADVTPNVGYQLNVTSLSVGLRRSGTGPASGRLAYSVNGGPWIDQGFDVAPNNASCNSVTNCNWILPSTIVANSSFKFRIFMWNASGPTTGNQQILNLYINGTVTSSAPPCTTPSPAANFLYNVVNSTQTNIAYTAPAGGASGYVVVRSSSPTPSAAPVNGTSYAVGAALGGGTVIYSGTSTSVAATGLNPLLDYYYFIYAYNNTSCTGGPKYATVLIGDDRLPVITLDPLADTICAGTNAVYTIAATDAISYQWQELTTSWNNITNNTVYSGTQTSTLLISGATSTLNGRSYRCIAVGTGNINDTSAGALLVVNDLPVVTTGPVSAAICPGADTSFSIAATGTQISFQWQENAGGGFTNIVNGGVFTGATTNHLQLLNSPANYSGHLYRCIVYNSCTPSDTSASASLTINTLPSVAVTAAGPVTFCSGDSVALSTPSATGLTYQWLLNSANIAGATQSQVTVSASGGYAVLVSNTITGCTNTSSAQTITVNPLPAAIITPSGNTTFCAGNSVVLQSTTGAGWDYQWRLNGVLIAGGTNSAATVTTAGGSYDLITTNTVTGCTYTTGSVMVQINPLPTATATATGSVNFCLGNSVVLQANTGTGIQYQWQQNNADISGETNASYTAVSTGNFTVKVTTIATGCFTLSTPVAVNVSPLIAPFSISPSAPVTACDATLLTSGYTSAGVSYQWQQNGIDIPGAVATIYQATATALYTVKVTNASGCNQISSGVNVTINKSPVALITYSSPLVFCEGGAVALNAYAGNAGSIAYGWMKDGIPLTGATNNTYVVDGTGAYIVKLSNSFGCTTVSSPVSVSVYPLPQPVISRTGMTLSTGAYLSYAWYLNNQIIPGADSMSFTAVANGGYTVNVTDFNGCVNKSGVVIINNVGIASVNTADPITIYPNPATDIVYIKTKNAVSVLVYDMVGKLVINAPQINAQLNVHNLASGQYTIRVLDEHQQILAQQLISITRL